MEPGASDSPSSGHVGRSHHQVRLPSPAMPCFLWQSRGNPGQEPSGEVISRLPAEDDGQFVQEGALGKR